MTRYVALAALAGFATPALAQSFVTDTIDDAPGFGGVLDSGPAVLDSTTIDARMDALDADADAMGCTTVHWAGTWVRGRSPRVQGTTELSESVTGPNITNGMVEGVAFSASLTTGGGFSGSTAEGNELHGYFTRLGGKRSIWYGVEVVCDIEVEPTVFPAQAPIDGVPMLLDFSGSNVILASSAEGDVAQLASGGETIILPGDVLAICPGSPTVEFEDFDVWFGHVFDVQVPNVTIVGQSIAIGSAVFAADLSTTVIVSDPISRLFTFEVGTTVSGTPPTVHSTGTVTYDLPAPPDPGLEIVPVPFETMHPSIDFGNVFDGCPVAI